MELTKPEAHRPQRSPEFTAIAGAKRKVLNIFVENVAHCLLDILNQQSAGGFTKPEVHWPQLSFENTAIAGT